ncbi:MAG: Response regulator PleD [Spirochaetes bacterium ADurb.Bin218]|jgi:two-component system cell cycle response regulator|nr:MAG: Response regulator PleD [Spirochaetes bacterium ADurb.Bin218]HOV07711.1 diguanylate cyclase [Spirochaetota bacterium]HPD77398.1 diguanylate cyclase [Spirochaetota bacterium]HRS63181.1 diguanylate cyclase [Spirochaetota bacterium]HRU66074.1 diguanylate cyclase [Spirochaetota bacterium]
MYKILHLETSMLYQTVIREICVEISAIYINATKASEAFEILQREKISLILTAMELESGSAIDFIKSLNESQFRDIPVVVFTGNDSLEDRKRMYELGIVDYILKTSDKEVIKQNLSIFRKEDPVALRMRELTYAVVDDNKMDRKIISRIFSMHDIKKADFFDSEQMLLNSDIHYDVYVIDLVLKETLGDKVISALRKKNLDSVIIAVSGIDNVKTISRVLSIGADDYITKPFNYDLFFTRLKTNIRNFLLMRELKVKTDLLERISITDPLTELFNRRHIFDRLNQECEKFKRYGLTFTAVMLDIDGFKSINDSYGHQVGDMVIRMVSDAIKKSIRNVDIAGRYGGEEFLIILPEIDGKGGVVAAERIRKSIESIKIEESNIKVTISAGVAEFAGEPIDDFIKKIDSMLYLAKKNGKNRIESAAL